MMEEDEIQPEENFEHEEEENGENMEDYVNDSSAKFVGHKGIFNFSIFNFKSHFQFY